ncbi:MAG TPA: J domain-containing protein [Candidatus Nanoarchaeia archaeon]|nr:J domain-containing protein [Candidatus Nanoarchaeia archaeon]
MPNQISRREAIQRLGLEDQASADEIKKAYRHLAIKYHPDKHPDDPKTTERQFIDVTEAYDILTSSAGADLQEMGLRGPEAFTSRLSRWAQEIGGDAKARRETERRERDKKDAEREAKRQERQEQLRNEWREEYDRSRSEGKQISPKPKEGRFMTLEELSEEITRKEKYASARKQTTSPLKPDASTGARVQEWEYHPQPKTKPIHSKPETELSTEERIRHYYKQAEDLVLKETGSGLALDIIVNRIVGKHKVAEGEINELLAQAVVYTKRVLYHEVKTIPKEEVAETSKTIVQAKSIEQLLVTGSAVQAILSEWDVGRNTFLIADDSRDYSQPRRYGLFFKSTYQALLPHCKSQEDIPRLAKVIDAALKYEDGRKTYQENTEEIANLIATAVSGVTLEFAEEIFRKISHSLKSHFPGSQYYPPLKSISRQYQQVKDSLDSIIAEGYTSEEVLGILSIIERIQDYDETHFGVRSFKNIADFILAIKEIVPRDKLALTQRLVEPLAVGGWGYGQDIFERVVGSWRNIVRDVLPFYESLDEEQNSLFNRSMTALKQLQGREYSLNGRTEQLSWTKEISANVEAAAYAGKLIVEEALRCPNPRKVIDEFSNFLREYRYSEFFPIRRKKDWMPLTPTAKQREAYTYLSELQNKHNGAPLKLSPDQLGKVIEIYFK